MVSVLFLLSVSAPQEISLKVGGLTRTALLYRAKAAVAPTVFVFHGFTGNAKQAASSYRVHEAWPEANVVYPQGLEVSLLGRKGPGWQISARLNGDRDLSFFDALRDELVAKHGADPKRLYSCGMSNGAIFTYLLLGTRGDKLKAGAAVGGYAPPAFRGAKNPVLIIHGKDDAIIPLNWATRSRDTAIENIKGKDAKAWKEGYARHMGEKDGEVVWHEHPGGHTWPSGTTDAIVKFFRER